MNKARSSTTATRGPTRSSIAWPESGSILVTTAAAATPREGRYAVIVKEECEHRDLDFNPPTSGSDSGSGS